MARKEGAGWFSVDNYTIGRSTNMESFSGARLAIEAMTRLKKKHPGKHVGITYYSDRDNYFYEYRTPKKYVGRVKKIKKAVGWKEVD